MKDKHKQPGKKPRAEDRIGGGPKLGRPVLRSHSELGLGALLTRPYSDATLWEIVRSCFELDDGSLPEVGLVSLTSKQVELIVGQIRSQSGGPTRSPTFIPNESGSGPTEGSLDAMVESVLGDQAVNVRFLLGDLVHDGVTLPEIMVCVWRESVTLEYRQGSGWTRDAVVSLFSLLQAFHAMAPQARLECDCEVPDPDAFLAGWTYYLKFHPIDPKYRA